MDRIENGMHRINDSFTEIHKNFTLYYCLRGRKYLKYILTYLYSFKCYEINICHSDIQKHFSYKYGMISINILYTGSHKNFPIHYGLSGKNF